MTRLWPDAAMAAAVLNRRDEGRRAGNGRRPVGDDQQAPGHLLMNMLPFGTDLKARRHAVERGNGRRMGGCQAIMIDGAGGLLRGASDHRKDGMAMGW